MGKPFFGIKISTYRRKNGTFHLLARCLRSIESQIFQSWKVFLIGDDYRPAEEFEQLVNMITREKIYHENLKVSPERIKYFGHDLWRVAGHAATCFGLNKIKEEGIPICAHIDDDDWWQPDHLQTLWDAYQQFPEAVFIYTQSTYGSPDRLLPTDSDIQLDYDNVPPRGCELIHSAASWNVQKIPLTYRNVIEENSSCVCGDADMWDRINEYCVKNDLKTLYIPKLTVRHDSEDGMETIEPMLM